LFWQRHPLSLIRRQFPSSRFVVSSSPRSGERVSSSPISSPYLRKMQVMICNLRFLLNSNGHASSASPNFLEPILCCHSFVFSFRICSLGFWRKTGDNTLSHSPSFLITWTFHGRHSPLNVRCCPRLPFHPSCLSCKNPPIRLGKIYAPQLTCQSFFCLGLSTFPSSVQVRS